jgi:hypothetical protein
VVFDVQLMADAPGVFNAFKGAAGPGGEIVFGSAVE